jgi:uncharacterized surface protein with fasciclin (FAS1) repeats
MFFHNLVNKVGIILACLMLSGTVQAEVDSRLYTNTTAQPTTLPSRHANAYGEHIKSAVFYARRADNPVQLDMIDTVLVTGNFNYLVAAARQAGIIEILREDGPYTLFAPTDDAFAKLPNDQLVALMRDKKTLGRILTYHVVSGIVMKKQIMHMSSARSVHGGKIIIQFDKHVRVNNAKIIAADIPARNGIIHAIDTVLLPPEMMSMN